MSTVIPYKTSEEPKKAQVRLMFDNIAWRYDFLNNLLSFGLDKYWLKKAVQQLGKTQPKLILDMATGTADLALASLKTNPDKIVGIDISEGMLAFARKKIADRNLSDKIELIHGDAENIQFPDNNFDAVSVAYGVRNFENLSKGLDEMIRVLKPGGQLVILEFSKCTHPVFSLFYKIYFKYLLPQIGKLFSKDYSAYRYLFESVESFPSGEEFENILKQKGLKHTCVQPLTFGSCSIYSGIK